MAEVSDFSIPGIWQKLLTNCNVVIHLAARVHVTQEFSESPLEAFRLINLYGTKIFEEICINESIKEINLTYVTSGIYFVRVYDGENKYIHKVIIEF